MPKALTIQVPDDLEQQLILHASQLNVSLETLVLTSLQQIVAQPDPDDEPEELILESLRTSLQQIREGKVHPIAELWDGIDV
jgi:predicted transcriptional regulator